MDIKFFNQPKDVKLGEVLTEKLASGMFSRVWIFAGFAKDSGLDYLLEAIKVARDAGAVIECILGLDKKNTSKDMLLKLLNAGCKIRFHLNDDDCKLETRVYAFESDSSDSYVYLTGAKLSEGGLTDNMALITEISYPYSEKKEFNKVKANIENGVVVEKFETMNTVVLKELASTGEILARITERKIPSIRELYSSSDVEVGVQEYDESSSTNFNELVSKDFDIDIDFSGSGDVKVQDSLGEEVEHKIKTKNDKSSESTIKSKIVINRKDIDYDNMSTLIIPINKVVKKGVTANEIKIPSSITSNMQVFLGYPNDFHMETDSKGKLKEVKKIRLEIFENVMKNISIDEEAKIIQTDKNTVLKSEKFAELEIDENDMMRLIKKENGTFRCEIIKQDSSEYNIWESFCTIKTRGTSKNYGIS